MRKVVAVMLGLCLLVAVAGLAQTTKAVKQVTKPAPPKVTIKQASGAIKSADASSLVLTHKVAGKNEDTTFVLNADTKKDGDMTPGAKATVHYKVQNNQNIATMVKATPAVAAQAPPKAAPKKK